MSTAGAPVREGGPTAALAAAAAGPGQWRMLSRIVQQVGEAVAVTDNDARIVYANAEFARMHGCALDDLLAGAYRGSDFYGPEEWAGPVQDLMGDALASGIGRAELTRRRTDGSEFAASVTLSLLSDDGGTLVGRVLCIRDVTPQREAEESLRRANARLARLAATDLLTGLPNRALFADRLEQAMSLARREPRSVALLFVDVDRFKSVNDTLGHHHGDQVLAEVARRLVGALRECDTVARLGGDEFAVLLGGSASPEDAAAAAARLLAALRPAVVVGGVQLSVGASVGIAIWPEDCNSKAELLHHADVAMYRAKAAGGNRFEMFQPAMTVAARERLAVHAELRRAVEAGELRLRFAPQVDLSSGRVTGAEAVVWWDHPSQGGTPATALLGLAEETGLILPIGTWALGEACAQAARWRADVDPGLRVCVDVSARQLLHPGFVGSVRDALAASHLAPAALELEVPEAALVPDAPGAAAALRALRQVGVRLSADHFGSGCSSLSSVRQAPLDRLKLDRSLVAGVEAADRDLVAAIVALAHAVGIGTVAEGVTGDAQCAALAALGCDAAQGPRWGAPLPAADFLAVLRSPLRPAAAPRV